MTNLPAPNLFGTARDKAELFRERYSILQQVRKSFALFSKIHKRDAVFYVLTCATMFFVEVLL